MNKFVIYERWTEYILVASHTSDSRDRTIRIDRTPPQEELVVVHDDLTNGGEHVTEMLKMLEDENQSSGGGMLWDRRCVDTIVLCSLIRCLVAQRR
jgi:phosphatidylinositol 3,5-bisphosphate 5-phosphatase